MVQKAVFMERVFTLRNLRSASAAAIIEVLIAAGIAALLIWQQVGSSIQDKVVVPPVVIPDQTQPPLPHTTPDLQPPQERSIAEVPLIPTDVPTEQTLPVQPPPPPVGVGQPYRPSADLAAEFEASMLRAINAQKVYPKGPLLRSETGEVAVSFDYAGGVVSNIRVDRSSGSRELDQAALAAVQKAALPPKPAELAGIGHFVVSIGFTLGD